MADSLKLFALPPAAPFLPQLAALLLRDPSLGGALPARTLAALTIYLPSRRAAASLEDLLLRLHAGASGRPALLLPRLRALGDGGEEEESELVFASPNADETAGEAADETEGAEECPPPLSVLERHIVLASLIRRSGLSDRFGQQGWAGAAALAGELAGVFDLAARTGGNLTALEDFPPAGLAQHWQDIWRVLQPVLKLWPRYCADLGRSDPAEYRAFLLRRHALLARDRPVLLVGSTLSHAAAADMAAALARAPAGAVILPAYDFQLDAEGWDAIGPSHPQFGLKTALARIGARRSDIRLLTGASAPAKARFLSALFRPPDAPPKRVSKTLLAKVRGDFEIVEAANEEDAARLIAVILQKALARREKAALVTPDRVLAQRVRAELRRFGVNADDSAGASLLASRPLVFFRLVLAAAQEDAPKHYAALLKHPLAAAGLPPAQCRALIRQAELVMRRAFPETRPAFLAADGILQTARRQLAPLAKLLKRERADCRLLLAAHIAAAENLAASDSQTGAARLWMHAPAAQFFRDVMAAAAPIGEITPRDYGRLLVDLASRQQTPPPLAAGSVHIWGLLEQRLLAPDCTVIGGLQEGVLPAPPREDPWFNRAMRAHAGLPPPEYRAGQMAHDFTQCWAAKKIWLVSSATAGGETLVPSRWLQRLRAFVPRAASPAVEDITAAARALDRAPSSPHPSPPAPKPPAAARPVRVSVTAAGALLSNPYAFYAQRILRLAPLPELDEEPGAALFGTLMHRVLERAPLSDSEEEQKRALVKEARAVFQLYLAEPALRLFWWPKVEQAVEIAAPLLAAAQASGDEILREAKGKIKLQCGKNEIVLTAIADRIDIDSSGQAAIFDYKTGRIPGKKEIAWGFAPQLPLEAAIALAGGFARPVRAISCLAHIALARSQNFVVPVDNLVDDPRQLAADALAGFSRLAEKQLDPLQPYYFRAGGASRDYDHLARLAAWGGEV